MIKYAPTVWNGLPTTMKDTEDIESFNRQLKTLLFCEDNNQLIQMLQESTSLLEIMA